MKTILSMAFAATAIALLVPIEPLFASEADARMASSFANAYVCATYLKDDAVKADFKEGVATLTGHVAEDSHKILAQETAAYLPGVKRVDNRLQVDGDIPAANSDMGISARVQSMLSFHRIVSNNRTEVDVKNGIVVLRGKAISETQKVLTAHYARAIDGVKEVQNGMTVAETAEAHVGPTVEKIDDASINAMVKLTLQYHNPACLLSSKVEIANGVVYLYSTDSATADQDIVDVLAADIHGVSKVVNCKKNRVAVYFAIKSGAHRNPNELVVENSGSSRSAGTTAADGSPRQ